jgi:hypothetical protein
LKINYQKQKWAQFAKKSKFAVIHIVSDI